MKNDLQKHALFIKIMRLSLSQLVILLIMTGVSFAGITHAQEVLDKPITLDIKNQTLKEVLRKIESELDVKFAYSKEAIASLERISVHANNEKLSDVLDKLLKPRQIHYYVIGNQIILNRYVDFRGGLKNDDSILGSKSSENIISGKVTSEAGEPIPGVNIILKGTTIGTVTDVEGHYLLEVPDLTGTLLFSYIGYTTSEVPISGRTSVDVILLEDTRRLDEVVVVGYGTVKKSDLTGSVSSISSEEIKAMPLTSMDQGLQGRAAGVHVVQASGQPGGMATIRIRGGNSLQGGNEPLYVIDGFPVYNGGGFGVPGGGSAVNNVNGLASLNPNDIESIEVLKDASATAIYGSRGANGVVLITTKGGKKGRDIVSFESYYGVQEVRKTIDVMNATDFARLVNDAYTNDGLSAIYSESEISSFGEGTDWQDKIFRVAPIQNYQMSVSGGDDKTTYAVSGSYFDQQGIIIDSYFKRLSGRINLDRKINSDFNVGSHLTLNRSNTNVLQTSTNSGDNPGVVIAALMMSPIQKVYENEELGIYTPVNNTGFPIPNPVATAREIDNEMITTRLLGDVYAQYQIVKDLRARVSFGADIINNKGNYYVPSYVNQGKGNGGLGQVSSMLSTTWLNENTLSYNKQINQDHALNLLAGITFQGNRTEFVSASSQGFVTDALQENSLQSGAVYNTPVTSAPEWGLVSYLGRINYSWMEKYLFTLTGRVDGSSRFGRGNQYGFFPSGAVAWRMIEEKFIQDMRIFDDLKLRASFGLTGNQEIGQYNSLATMQSDNYTFGNALVTGFRPSRVPNPFLQWEKTGQFDVGLDMGFWRNRLRITADWYKKTTSDLLYSASVPWTSGFSTALQNIGSIENRGLELGIGADIFSGKFNWNSNFNIAFNENRVLDLGDIDFFFAASEGPLKNSQISRIEVGKPIGMFYGYVFDGIFQSDAEVINSAQPAAKPGDRRYKDLNGDGKISPEGDRTIIGRAQPKFFGGITNTLNWKGFELNIFANWSYGNDILNHNLLQLENPTGGGNALSAMVDRWTPDNPSQLYPRATRQRAILFSNRQLEDGSYVRIKTLTFSYSFPTLISDRLSGLKVYFTAQNLWTVTNYSGFDPEVSRHGTTNLTPGEDYGVYPVAKTFLLGVNLNIK